MNQENAELIAAFGAILACMNLENGNCLYGAEEGEQLDIISQVLLNQESGWVYWQKAGKSSGQDADAGICIDRETALEIIFGYITGEFYQDIKPSLPTNYMEEVQYLKEQIRDAINEEFIINEEPVTAEKSVVNEESATE
jgi:hypothetical protein